jgi:hypothetical protein
MGARENRSKNQIREKENKRKRERERERDNVKERIRQCISELRVGVKENMWLKKEIGEDDDENVT